jgi:murein DD-endopeptidase MepM/ murein hydrolase activator NlpD
MVKLAEQQAAKNSTAPVVGGTSGGGTLPAATNVNVANNFKTVGGKVIPVAGARLSQGWGKSKIKYAAGRHTGVDYAAATGTSVRSAGNGVVVRVGREGAYGNAIAVRQADGTTAFYAHLNRANVKPGQKVRAGQHIGQVGNTGRSTGSHLHFEIRSRDKYGGDINPYDWFGKK